MNYSMRYQNHLNCLLNFTETFIQGKNYLGNISSKMNSVHGIGVESIDISNCRCRYAKLKEHLPESI